MVEMTNFKPMLSGKAPDDLSKIKYPVAVSPKLDGFRCIIIDGVAMSRNLKPIRNEYVQQLFGKHEYNGYDGELIVGDPTSKTCFRDTSSGVTSRDGKPDVIFYVFDKYSNPNCWEGRYATIPTTVSKIIKVDHYIAKDALELIEFEQEFLEQGYEGLMIRDPYGPYKEGRSTTKEGYLLKLKRFEDSEALVIGMEEKMHNSNEATKNALGHTQRTSHQENLIPLNTMGALIVRDLKTGVEFNIGTGFDDDERAWWWAREFIGVPEIMNDGGKKKTGLVYSRIIKYKYFPQGSKDKPRFPTYLGMRHIDDVV